MYDTIFKWKYSLLPSYVQEKEEILEKDEAISLSIKERSDFVVDGRIAV